jgi:hypothetical protein
MKTPFPFIPWNTSALWREVNAGFEQLLRAKKTALADTRQFADRLHASMASLFPLLNDLCAITCTTCSDICCQRAYVWFDFKDLLFLHMADIPVPGAQLLSARGERCRYCGPHGCRLERIQRPFVCTLYLCPAQTLRLREDRTAMQTTTEDLQRIKRTRQAMETAFIGALMT